MKRSDVDALVFALGEVWSGADRLDAEAVADHLEDLGVTGFQHARVRPEDPEPELPLASTAGLPKRRTS